MCFLHKTVEDVVRTVGTRGQRTTVKPSSCLGTSWLCYVPVLPYPTTCHSWTSALWLMLYQMYNPKALRVKLESGPTVHRTLEEEQAAVRAACDAEGIVLCVVKSSRAHDGVSEQYGMKKLTFQ